MALTEVPDVLFRTREKCPSLVQTLSALRLPTAVTGGTSSALAIFFLSYFFFFFFFGSSPLPASPTEATEIVDKEKRRKERSASTPAPIYVNNMQGESCTDEQKRVPVSLALKVWM